MPYNTTKILVTVIMIGIVTTLLFIAMYDILKWWKRKQEKREMGRWIIEQKMEGNNWWERIKQWIIQKVENKMLKERMKMEGGKANCLCDRYANDVFSVKRIHDGVDDVICLYNKNDSTHHYYQNELYFPIPSNSTTLKNKNWAKYGVKCEQITHKNIDYHLNDSASKQCEMRKGHGIDASHTILHWCHRYTIRNYDIKLNKLNGHFWGYIIHAMELIGHYVLGYLLSYFTASNIIAISDGNNYLKKGVNWDTQVYSAKTDTTNLKSKAAEMLTVENIQYNDMSRVIINANRIIVALQKMFLSSNDALKPYLFDVVEECTIANDVYDELIKTLNIPNNNNDVKKHIHIKFYNAMHNIIKYAIDKNSVLNKYETSLLTNTSGAWDFNMMNENNISADDDNTNTETIITITTPNVSTFTRTWIKHIPATIIDVTKRQASVRRKIYTLPKIDKSQTFEEGYFNADDESPPLNCISDDDNDETSQCLQRNEQINNNTCTVNSFKQTAHVHKKALYDSYNESDDEADDEDDLPPQTQFAQNTQCLPTCESPEYYEYIRNKEQQYQHNEHYNEFTQPLQQSSKFDLSHLQRLQLQQPQQQPQHLLQQLQQPQLQPYPPQRNNSLFHKLFSWMNYPNLNDELDLTHNNFTSSHDTHTQLNDINLNTPNIEHIILNNPT